MSKDSHLEAGEYACYLSTEWWKTSKMVKLSLRHMEIWAGL